MSRFSPHQISEQNTQSTSVFARAHGALVVMNTNVVRWILITLTVVLGGLYLWLVNSSATAGFYLSDLDKRMVKLDLEYRSLELRQAALESLDHVEKQSQALQMVASTDVVYARGDTSVALGDSQK